MEKNFVYIDEEVPGIRWDAKYATWDNFTGAPVDGYEANRIIGTRELAAGVRKLKERSERLGYGLLLWDGYRPQRAVDCFLHWASNCQTDKTKAKHYPHIDRKTMIDEGYIARKSGHSRGSTLDLTLYKLSTNELLPMGGDFDLMDEISHHNANGITFEEEKNRILLRDLMDYAGFEPYENEWWHYSLRNEPFPDTYYDFAIV